MRIAARHIETDPLDAIRAELVRAARRQSARRRARRQMIGIAAAVLALLAATAGASALSGFTTGIPMVDELLDNTSRPTVDAQQPPGGTGAPGNVPSAPGPDLRPGPGGATEPLAVPTGDGVAQAVAYVSRDGTICNATAEPHPRIEGEVRGGAGGCYVPANLARKLERHGIAWSGVAAGPERRVFDGYADADVRSIRVIGADTDVEVQLTEPWTPDVPSADALRFFVIVDEADIDVGGDGVQPDDMPLIPMDFPAVEVTHGDGRSVEIRGD